MAVDVKNDLAGIRWYDCKQITFLSTAVADEPVEMCKRWSKQECRQIEIPRPAVTKLYNESMGGEDLFGMLISLNRINIESKRGYMKIVFWCFNVGVCNGWLLYV